ncbi:MAG TPA: LytR C-terminal domain-containing protein [Acidimicrobiales bacterium]|nr:LytR C-terminal domain-containing protein [Acidimicrobiales bacterium]
MSDTTGGRRGGEDGHDFFGPLERSGAARGWALVVGALIVGAILMPSATRGTLAAAGTPDTTEALAPVGSGPTTTAAPATTTTRPASTTTAAPASSIRVLVANGTNTNGAAGTWTQFLSGKGYATLSAVDALTTVHATQIYAVNGATAAADQVAQALGLTASAVEPASMPIPVASVGNAAVVVVVGPDLAGRSTSSSTT